MLCRYAVFGLNLLFASIATTGLSLRCIGLIPGFVRCRLCPLLNGSASAWRTVGGNSDDLVSLPVVALLRGPLHYEIQAAANHTVPISLLVPRHRGDFM